MITYNWNCKTVDVYPLDPAYPEYPDVVYNVHWVVYAQNEDGYATSSIGTQILDTTDITDFIPFSELTNEQAVAWTQATMGPEQVTQIEANLADQIEQLVHPSSVTMTIGGTEIPMPEPEIPMPEEEEGL